MIIDFDKLADAIADRVIQRMNMVGGDKPEIWLSRRGVADTLGVSMTTVYRLQAMPGFPAPVRRHGSTRSYWAASKINEWADNNSVTDK